MQKVPQRIQLLLLKQQRAGAIGIVLDAPATYDPADIAVAYESTVMDPIFLSALPEEMLSDVFIQFSIPCAIHTKREEVQLRNRSRG